jgi:hypothetical protein
VAPAGADQPAPTTEGIAPTTPESAVPAPQATPQATPAPQAAQPGGTVAPNLQP